MRPTFTDSLSAFVDALGFENAPTAWELAKGDWQSVEHRQGFIDGLMGVQANGVA